MADRRDTLKIFLNNDASLADILTGGIIDQKDVGRRGVTTKNMPQDVNGAVLPFSYIKWSSGNRIGRRKQRGLQQTIEIYVYSNDDHHVIENATDRMIVLLDDIYLNTEDTTFFFLEYTFESGELVAPHLNDIPMQFIRFRATTVRN